jgi:glycosyltransferase involved in cell wall biosynthesis
MTTVLYLSLYPTLGGAEKALLHLLAALDRTRVRPIAVLPAEGPFLKALQAAGVETVVEPFPTPPLYRLASPRVWAALRRASARLSRLVEERQVSLVHCGDLLAVLLVLPALRRGVGLVYQVNYLGGRGRRWALRLVSSLERQVTVAWSHAQRDEICRGRASPACSPVVVYPGLLPSDLQGGDGAAFRREIGVPPHAPLVGMLSRFDAWKGHHVFLEAARQVLSVRKDTRFAVIGGALNADWLPHVGRYEAEVREAARRLSLEEALVFVPHREDVAGALAALDIVVCPSLGEPFGMVVIEAMAAGRPIVASDSGGPAEILRHDDTGVLFPTGDPYALARALTTLLDAPPSGQRLGAAARDDVAARFHRDRYAADIQAVYDRLG